MARLVLIGAELFPHLRDLLRAEAARSGARTVEVSEEDWGTTLTPWVELKDGCFRAGMLGPDSPGELTREDVFWCLSERPPPPAPSDYLRTEHEALRDGFHTCCPARAVNRRGLLAPLWTMAVWRLLALRLPAREDASVLFPPHLHLGPPPEDGRRWKPWPREAELSRARVWWTVPTPGALHLAVVTGQRVTLWALEAEAAPCATPPELEADLLGLAVRCGAEYLEVLLVPDGSAQGTARWTALQLSALPEELETLLSRERGPARAQVEHFVRTLLTGGEDAR